GRVQESLSRAEVLGDLVMFEFGENEVRLSVDSPDRGSISESIVMAQSCPEMRFRAPIKQVREALRRVDTPQFRLCLRDPHSPIFFRPSDGPSYVQIVMPMQA